MTSAAFALATAWKPVAPPAPLVAESVVSDEALVAQVCEGSREALAALFRRFARVVRGTAYRILRDASEADDLLQDIFLFIHCKCVLFDPSKGSARYRRIDAVGE